MNINELKEKYPELAGKSIGDIVQTDAFADALLKIVGRMRSNNTLLAPYRLAFRSLDAQDVFGAENFRKEYLACLDKVSKRPHNMRVVIWTIGNQAWQKAIQKLMADYDKLKKE